MDKNTYETYEFLQTTNHTSEPEFLVVQDDATFLINQGVQYVSQIEDVKTTLGNRSCTMFNVGEQQLFIDVENSGELITVSDEMILPGGASNLFTNNYLIQPVPTVSTIPSGQVQENGISKAATDSTLQKTDIQQTGVEEDNSKQNTQFTEITLSDEQCQMLEQNGWIMLKSNDRVYVLDTLGLHDITNNDELIQKLVNEIPSNEEEEKCVKVISDVSSSQEVAINSIEPMSEEESKGEALQIHFQNDVEESSELQKLVIRMSENQTNEDVKTEKREIDIYNNTEVNSSIKSGNNVVTESENIDEIERRDGVVRIKTKRCFKDIPDKVILGKTKNGKILVARRKLASEEQVSCDEKDHSRPNSCSITSYDDEDDAEDSKYNGTEEINTSDILIKILERRSVPCTLEDINVATSLISRLLQAPTLKKSIVQNKLAFTRVQENYDVSGNLISKSDPILVSGRMVVNSKKLEFQHQPKIIDEMIGLVNTTQNGNSGSSQILHIHVTENVTYENSDEKKVTNSITLNERVTPIIKLENKNTSQRTLCSTKTQAKVEKFKEKKNESTNSTNLLKNQCAREGTPAKLQRLQPNKIPKVSFACGACATLFSTQAEIDDHQKTECSTNQRDEGAVKKKLACLKLETAKGNVFACSFCMAKFSKLLNCQRHLKNHSNQRTKNENDTAASRNEEIYRCSICFTTFSHPSTLTRHILSAHIVKE